MRHFPSLPVGAISSTVVANRILLTYRQQPWLWDIWIPCKTRLGSCNRAWNPRLLETKGGSWSVRCIIRNAVYKIPLFHFPRHPSSPPYVYIHSFCIFVTKFATLLYRCCLILIYYFSCPTSLELIFEGWLKIFILLRRVRRCQR